MSLGLEGEVLGFQGAFFPRISKIYICRCRARRTRSITFRQRCSVASFKCTKCRMPRGSWFWLIPTNWTDVAALGLNLIPTLQHWPSAGIGFVVGVACLVAANYDCRVLDWYMAKIGRAAGRTSRGRLSLRKLMNKWAPTIMSGLRMSGDCHLGLTGCWYIFTRPPWHFWEASQNTGD